MIRLMKCIFSVISGCFCLAYFLFGWTTLLNQLQQTYTDQVAGLFESYQSSKWPIRTTPAQEDLSNQTKRFSKDKAPSSTKTPQSEVESNSTRSRYLEDEWSISTRRPPEVGWPISTRKPPGEGWPISTRKPPGESWPISTRKPLEERWIVVVCVSEGFDSIFQNWWVWFRKLNLDMDVFLVAEDHKTMQKYNTSTQLRLHQGVIDRNMSSMRGLSYNSSNYNKLVSRRAGYILNFLQKNYSTIYSDIDTVWLKDPTPYFKGDFDMWGQSDDSAHPRKHQFCTGFLAIKPTEASRQFIQKWDSILTKRAAANKPIVNQNVFNQLLWKQKLRTMNLPSSQFVTGNDYQFSKPPPSHVVLVHNNFVIGLTNKIKRFNTSGLWTQTEKL